jgi:glucosylceramidase
MKKLFAILMVLAGYSVFAQNVKIYTTANQTDQKLTLTGNPDLIPTGQPVETQICIFVNPKKSFQTVVGIGGAITDASAEVFYKLPVEKQKEILNAYYDKKSGIGYNLIRTNINSCDFSSDSYTYVQEGDTALKTWDISHDLKYKVPLIKEAFKKAGETPTFYVSPWSPPAFMKTNNNMLHGGKLLPEFSQSWANYYVKFIKNYEKIGLPVWGLTIQNEPMATQTWESCIYSAEDERDFLKKYLGPTLKKSGLGTKKIVVWDHNRDLLTQRASTILDDPDAAQYVYGVGFHWYENWSGGDPMFENVDKVQEMYPDKKLLFTEGCVERFNPANYQLWANGERYGKSLINDFNNGVVAWTDWNILLDEKGGPNHVGNFCFAPIHADLSTNEIIYTPSYYMIGHFSKFIKKGAKRIANSASRSQLLSTSFKNPDGQLVTIVLNLSDREVLYKYYVGQKATDITIPAKAIQTLVF